MTEMTRGRDAAPTRTADIIIVGSGPGGLSAAVHAHRLGNSVVILEKAPTHGGTAVKAAACFWVPNNGFMAEHGYSDTKDGTLRFMARTARPVGYDLTDPHLGLPTWQYDLLEAYYDNAWTAIQTLEEAGGLRATLDTPLGVHMPDYVVVDCNETPYGRALFPLKDDGSVGAGPDLIGRLKAAVDARNIPLLTEHRVVETVSDHDGAVTGVRVDTPTEKSVEFVARKAVIFATGGFTHNADMRLNFLSGPTFGGCAAATNTGDFVDIVARLGVRLRNMNYAWMAPLVVDLAVAQDPAISGVFLVGGDSMLWVNKYGRRVGNEKAPYHDSALTFHQWDAHKVEYPNIVQFMIWDQRSAERYGIPAFGNPIPVDHTDLPPHVLRGDSLQELAERIDERLETLAAHTGNVRLQREFLDNLTRTVARFNEYARDGKDLEFHRGETPIEPVYSGPAQPDNPGNPTMFPLADTGPYYAVILGAGTLDTKGGPVTNASAQVLDTDGQPIPGLYGVGNCVASGSGQGYFAGGATIGPILTFAYLAAEAANLEKARTETVAFVP